MKESQDGGPFHPTQGFQTDAGGAFCGQYFNHKGISLRDYFASQALIGMLAYSHVNPQRGNYHENSTFDGTAQDAYVYADAMLSARIKEQPNGEAE